MMIKIYLLIIKFLRRKNCFLVPGSGIKIGKKNIKKLIEEITLFLLL